MTIHDRLAALAGELHLSGFGSEMNEAWTRATALFADEIHALSGGSALQDAANVADLVKTEVAKAATAGATDVSALAEQVSAALGDKLAAAVKDIEATLDSRVEARFHALLAAAAAAPAQPAAAAVTLPASVTAPRQAVSDPADPAQPGA